MRPGGVDAHADDEQSSLDSLALTRCQIVPGLTCLLGVLAENVAQEMKDRARGVVVQHPPQLLLRSLLGHGVGPSGLARSSSASSEGGPTSRTAISMCPASSNGGRLTRSRTWPAFCRNSTRSTRVITSMVFAPP